MNRALGVMAVTVVLATGCASRGSVGRLQSDVAALRSDLAAARAVQDAAMLELAQARAEIQALDARARAMDDALRAVRDDLVKLAARLDAAEEEIKKTRALVEALPPPPPPPSPPAEKRAEPREGRDEPAAAERAYAAALRTVRAREYGQAVLDFIDFVGQYPRHPLAANAQYWIGEAYYVQGDYRQALLEFQKVVEMRSGKIPDALVKIGLCHWSLRDPHRARVTWQRVVREYPSTESARTARGLLRKHAPTRR